jgi:hypothetical protein
MTRHTSAIYKDDVGARIVLPLQKRDGQPLDVSLATLMRIRCSHAVSGADFQPDASFADPPFGNGTGTDGVIEVVTTALTLPGGFVFTESGVWVLQPYIEFAGGAEKFHGQPSTVHIGEIPATPIL